MTDSTNAVERIKSDLDFLSKEDLKVLSQEIIHRLTAKNATEPLQIEDVAPVDVPIHDLKDEETGALRIRFPFQTGYRNILGWRTLKVTLAAQEALLHIFSESLAADDLAGRSPPKPTSYQ